MMNPLSIFSLVVSNGSDDVHNGQQYLDHHLGSSSKLMAIRLRRDSSKLGAYFSDR